MKTDDPQKGRSVLGWPIAILCWFFMMHFAVGVAFADPTIDEEKGQQAERAGKLNEALRYYVTALQAFPEDSEADQRVRKEIIVLTNKLNPKPAIPDEAKRFFVRGEAAIEMAKDNAGYQRAADEFKQALKIAPWYPEGYYNLGIVQDKAGNYSAAIRNLDFYLLSAPNATDSEVVRTQIIKLQYKLEQPAATPSAQPNHNEVAPVVLTTGIELSALQGGWKEYCTAIPPQIPPTSWQIKAVDDTRFMMRDWDDGLNGWSAWREYTYDPSSQTFPFAGQGNVKVVSANYMIQEFPNGHKCEWKR